MPGSHLEALCLLGPGLRPAKALVAAESPAPGTASVLQGQPFLALRGDHQTALVCCPKSPHSALLGRKEVARPKCALCLGRSWKASVAQRQGGCQQQTSLGLALRASRSESLLACLKPGEAEIAPSCSPPKGETLTCGSRLPSEQQWLSGNQRSVYSGQCCIVPGARTKDRKDHPQGGSGCAFSLPPRIAWTAQLPERASSSGASSVFDGSVGAPRGLDPRARGGTGRGECARGGARRARAGALGERASQAERSRAEPS